LTSGSNLLRFLRGVKVGTNDLSHLEESTGMGMRTLTEVAGDLEDAGALRVEGGSVRLRPGGRVMVARLAVQSGASLEEMGRCLDWREFEELAALALESCGFKVTRNLILTNPRRQIDVVGVDGEFGIAFDCKHWGSVSPSQMAEAARRQVERARLLLEKRPLDPLREVIPAILVLYRPGFGKAHGIAIVPVDSVFDFIMGARGNAGDLSVVRTDGGGGPRKGAQRRL
jgi:hypothetical protein